MDQNIRDDFSNYNFMKLQNLLAALDESVIVAVTDAHGTITFANNQFCKISKYSTQELIGKNHNILNSGFHPPSFFQNMWQIIKSGQNWHGEICNRAKDGTLYWVKTTIVPFLNDQKVPHQYIAIRTDITAQKNLKQISNLVFYDDLTGLPNRRNLMTRLESDLKIAKEKEHPFAIFILNVNRFKHINNELGHSAGDAFLQTLANRLRAIDHTSGSFYRINSDEFVFVLHDTSLINEMASKIMKVFETKFQYNGYEFYSSISIGISRFPQDGETVQDLMNAADHAKRSAKQSKNNSYRIFSDSSHKENAKWLKIETKLHQAIKKDLLEIHYQPKYNIHTSRIVGLEALVRWTDDELGPVPPMHFIPIAEECGLINDIGVLVLKKACARMKKWNDEHNTNYHISVNISPIHLSTPGFLEMIEDVLNETGIQPKHLEIEITEMSLMDYSEGILKIISRIKEVGAMISIDDFGTGYSSLSYLKKFPVNTLKIDRSFVSDIGKEKTGVAMISAIISIANALNLEVIAEGVEEEYELNVLRENGCNYVQGYYFSKPLDEQTCSQKIFEENNL